MASSAQRDTYAMTARPRAGLALIGLVICALGIIYLASDIRPRIEELATSNSDTIQWSLGQAEVELLALQAAVRAPSTGGAVDFQEVRRRFDVFYSRMDTIARGAQYARILEISRNRETLAAVDRFLDFGSGMFEGREAFSPSDLSAMDQAISRIRPAIRSLSLSAVGLFAKDADAKRAEVSNLLLEVAGLTLILVATLFVFSSLFLHLVYVNRSRVLEQARTTSRLAAVISTSLDAIIVVDRSGRILEFNSAAEDIFGYSKREAFHQDMGDLIIPKHLRAAHEAGMERYRKTGERRVTGKGLLRLEAMRKDGSVFPVEMSISAAGSVGDEIFVSFLRDISTRVAAEKELVEARDKALAGEQAKADLLAVMSHEMRTPLNGVLGTMDLLRTTPLNQQQKSYLEIMRMSGNLLLHHLNGVLEISKLDSGSVEIASVPFDANEMVREIAESQKGLAKSAGNTLSVETSDPTMDNVVGDVMRVQQVLLNLVNNAIKFTRNGHVSIECQRLGGGEMVEFRVKDNGIGISAKNLSRIFDDFVTLDASFSRRTEGTGLGLGICRRVAEALGGQINVRSQPGVGSVFTFRVPLSSAGGRLSNAATKRLPKTLTDLSPRNTPLYVLLVEDNHVNRVVAREMLEKLGHIISEAHNGREAVALAKKFAFDLILMDISMPEMDGVTAARKIHETCELNKTVPIVALTANVLPKDIEYYEDSGMSATVTKPVSTADLAEVIMSVVLKSPKFTKEEPQPMQETDLIDLSLFETMQRDLGEDRMAALVKNFLSDAEPRVEALLGWGEVTTDPSGLKAEVHKLAGSAAVFGAVRLQRLLSGIETALRQSDFASASQGMSKVEDVWRDTREVLAAV
ncbi:MAG: PAS domain S-box protein [Rhodobacteraceae bacterium]|nr:PAS domain S-box protein [Paracoccaceae bacterium]